MSNEVNLVDLYESVCEASSWHAAMKCLTEALGEIKGVIEWVDKLIDAGENRSRTLDVLRSYAKEAGWQVIENRASHRFTPNDELDALREENLRLKGNLEHYAKQLRDVPPPGTKERLAEALEKLQTETLKSAMLMRELVLLRSEHRLFEMEVEYEKSRAEHIARMAEHKTAWEQAMRAWAKAVNSGTNPEDKVEVESLGLGADQNLEE